VGSDNVDISAGRFFNPHDPAGLLSLPLMRDPTPEETNPVALSALLVRQLARRSVKGCLILEQSGKKAELPIIEGVGFMTNPEKVLVMRAFTWTEGTFRFDPTPRNPRKRNRYIMGRLAMDGLRATIRKLRIPDIENALGDRLAMAPVVRKDRTFILEMGLSDPEKRLIRLQMGGKRSIDDISKRSGIGRQTALQLIFLLTVFDSLQWKKATESEAASLSAELEELAVRAEKGNFFEVLQIHWSLDTDEIEDAYRKMRKKLEPGGSWDRHNPDACRRMRARVEEAYELLRDTDRRSAYRAQAYPDIFYEATAQLVEGQIKSYQFRYDKTGLREAVRTRQELKRGREAAREVSLPGAATAEDRKKKSE
jgi:hypothetical protein